MYCVTELRWYKKMRLFGFCFRWKYRQSHIWFLLFLSASSMHVHNPPSCNTIRFSHTYQSAQPWHHTGRISRPPREKRNFILHPRTPRCIKSELSSIANSPRRLTSEYIRVHWIIPVESSRGECAHHHLGCQKTRWHLKKTSRGQEVSFALPRRPYQEMILLPTLFPSTLLFRPYYLRTVPCSTACHPGPFFSSLFSDNLAIIPPPARPLPSGSLLPPLYGSLRVLPTRVKWVCLFSGFLEIRFRRSKGRGVQLLRFTRVSISSSSFSSSSTVTSFFSSFSSLPTSSQHESICMGLRRTVLDANVLTTLRPTI